MNKKQVVFTNAAANKYREAANRIKENLVVSGSAITEKTSHLAYDAGLPEGLTPEKLTALSTYNGEYAQAARVAIAETAAEVFLNNSEVDRVEAVVGYGAPGDTMKLSTDRTHSYPNNKAKGEDDKVTIKHLVMTDSFEIKTPSYKALRAAMGVEFRDSFNK